MRYRNRFHAVYHARWGIRRAIGMVNTVVVLAGGWYEYQLPVDMLEVGGLLRHQASRIDILTGIERLRVSHGAGAIMAGAVGELHQHLARAQ